MRILFMADVPRDPNAGAAGTEIRTADALRALGHDVDEVWSPQLGRRIEHGNLHYLLELPRAYRREMLRATARKHYDVIHVNQPHGYLAAKAKPRGTIFVHRSHGLELRAERDLAPWRPRPKLVSRAMAALLARHSREIARYADGHIVSCSDDADFLVRELGVAARRIAVIPQASPFTGDAPAMSEERLRRVLHVGQFAFFKAPTVVAAAMRALTDRGLQCTWVCGRAHHADVRQLLGDAPVELLDWMPAEALRDVYDAHGIFLFASYFEGFGKVFLEAMSRGLCVVTTRAGGARDVVVHGESGLFVERGDPAAMVDAVSSLLAAPARAAEMAANAARVARTYTWERVARETAAFYDSLQ
ncbi:MAG TPA: glycosyltransferase family 4 protein [Thermoanaerobaculia bacterium]|nr:glycosyltransferase family 4 protein [Thermoanaerobaculia bacterium]